MKTSKFSFLFCFVSLLLIIGCKNENPIEGQINELIAGDMSKLNDIRNQLSNWKGDAKELSDKTIQISNYLTENNHPADAVQLINSALKNHFDGVDVKALSGSLATIYATKLNKPKQAEFLKLSIDGKPAELLEGIKELGKTIFADSTKGFDRELAHEFVTASENYALLNPKDQNTPRVLIDASTIARNLNQKNKTLEFFQWVYQKYPNHPKAADAMFYEGFTYDSDFKDLEKAKASYAAFIAKYPEHPFAEQAKVMMNNLGKSDEELLKSLGK